MSIDLIPHRRGIDGELLGWIEPVGDDFRVIDLLGRHRTEPVDWMTAETTLEELGIGYLADPYELLIDGVWRRVYILEVRPPVIVVKEDDLNAVGAALVRHELDWPVGDLLRSVDPRTTRVWPSTGASTA